MDPAEFSHLAEILSKPRLFAYVNECEGDVRRAIRLYTWNADVSSSFWGPLHFLEIGLRNAIDIQMRERWERVDWWEHSDLRLHREMRDQLARARELATKTAVRKGRDVVADDIVAALSLGFWSGLLSTGGSYQYETKLWQPFLKNAFPNFKGSRSNLYKEINSLRLLRNRIAHHEPIFRRHLAADHQSILRVAHSISGELRAYIASQSRVIETLNRRDLFIEQGDSASS